MQDGRGLIQPSEYSSLDGETSVAGVDLGDLGVAGTVRAGLAAVERALESELAHDDPLLSEVAMHLIRAGGKRFRPLFTLLAAQLGPNPEDPLVVVSATVVELVHLATLYHDDVMDGAHVRRGALSANARWDNRIAVFGGDYLFARASRLGARLGPDGVTTMANAFGELVDGQARETAGAAPDSDPIGHYLRVVHEKTGSLIATAARYGGLYSGASAGDTERLYRLGAAVGTAFQIADDIIDITSAASESGKTPGTDLREGVRTLPVLYALSADSPERDRLRELLVGPVESEGDVLEALALLSDSAGLAMARQRLAEYADSARAQLIELPDCPANTALRRLVDYTVERAA
ncbi:polyprenyl synthetase family protein [Nocardia sp. NPDC046763]|uniref:polyprenyl synthetase family protein n=1 Tax=Nocardia sp. NPDC046763 TaxID=3155256 RepID=UPI0033DCDAFE